MDIVIGITTAPRSNGVTYLGPCVASIRAAGFEDVRIFAEPDSPLNGCDGATIVQRATKRGAWRNWFEMCRDLLETTNAPIILTVQDDTLFSVAARQALEKYWPADTSEVGFVSLYTPAHYQRKFVVRTRRGKLLGNDPDRRSAEKRAAKNRRHKPTIEEFRYPIGCNLIKTDAMWGACALAFPRESLRLILDHEVARNWNGVSEYMVRDSSGREVKKLRRRQQAQEYVRKHRGTTSARVIRKPEDVANVDTLIGGVCNKLGLGMYFLNPAVAQHVGSHSTLGHGGVGGRMSALFVAPDLEHLGGNRRSPIVSPPATPNVDCVHRGEILRVLSSDLCGGCGRMSEVYRCSLHRECTPLKTAARIRSCLSCADYTADPATNVKKHSCVCSRPGQCAVFGRPMNAQEHTICRGEPLILGEGKRHEYNQATYVQHWTRQAMLRQPVG